MRQVRTAVIPVAGRGTRFLPATKAIPKELLPLVDKPVVQYIVEEAVSAGITRIVFVINSDKLAVEKHFSHDQELEFFLQSKGKDRALEAIASIADQAEYSFVPQHEPLGLGHAVLQAKESVEDEPFVVLSGDDVVRGGNAPATQELINCYQEHQGSVIGVLAVAHDVLNRYGVIDPLTVIDDTTMQLKGIVEKPDPNDAPSTYGVGGRWLLEPTIFDFLEKATPGAGGEIQLTDAILAMMQQHPVFAKVYSGTYHDCGNIIEYAKAVVSFSLEDPEIGPALAEYIRKEHFA